MPATAYHVLTATTPDDPAYEIKPSNWNSAHAVSIDLSNTEIIKWASAGANSISSGTLKFADSNGVSFGMDANGVVTATVVPGAAAGIAAMGAGTQTATSGTVVFANSNGASFGMSGSTQVTMDFGSSSLAGTGFTTTTVAGSVIAGTHATNGLLLAVPAFLTTQSVQTQASGNIARTGFTTTTVAGSVVAGTHDTAGLLLAVPAFLTTQSVQTQASGNIARTGFTTTTVAGSVIAGTHDTAGLLLGVPAYLTTAALSGDTTKYAGLGFTSTTTAGTDVKGTQSTNGLSMAFPAWLTTAALSGDTTKFAGTGFTSTTTAGTDVKATLNTAGLSMAVPAYLTAAAGGGTALTMYATSNTTQSSSGTMAMSSMIFAGAGIASVGITNGSVLISVPSGGGAGDGYNIVQAGSVGTTGTTWSSLSATISLNGYGALTVSQNNSNQIGLSVPATSSLVGASGIGVSTNGSTISIYDNQFCGYLEPYAQTNTSAWVPGVGSWYFAPFVAPARMSGGRINRLFVNTSTAGIMRDVTANYGSQSTGGKNQSYTYSNWLALYSQGTGTNSTRLESFWSNSFSFGLTHKLSVSQSGAGSSIQITVSQSISYISEIGSDGAYTLNQFASNNNSNCVNSSTASQQLDSVGVSIRNMLSNSIVMPVGFNTTIQAGNYWLAQMYSTTHNTATSGTSYAGASALIFSQLNQVGIQRVALESYRNWGSTATTARSQIFPGAGAVYTAASGAPPQYVAFSSDLATVANGIIPYFNFVNRGLTK